MFNNKRFRLDMSPCRIARNVGCISQIVGIILFFSHPWLGAVLAIGAPLVALGFALFFAWAFREPFESADPPGL